MAKKVENEILNIDDTLYQTELTGKFKNRKVWQEPDPKKVFSFIPGTILDIFVKKNQKIAEGDEMLLLEAMKMRNKVIAPITGTIKDVYVKKTQVVPKGFLLIEFK